MAFNEMRDQDGAVRRPYARVHEWLSTLTKTDVDRAQREAEGIFRRLGITFAVYGDDEASERLIPFDIIPRVFSAQEWRRLSAGIEQRVFALHEALRSHLDDFGHEEADVLRAIKALLAKLPQPD